MITETTEKRFEMDIADFLLSPAGGYTGNHDAYDPRLGLFPETLVRFVQKSRRSGRASSSRTRRSRSGSSASPSTPPAIWTGCCRCCATASSTGA